MIFMVRNKRAGDFRVLYWIHVGGLGLILSAYQCGRLESVTFQWGPQEYPILPT
jgi:hypothetical protein